MRFLPFDGVLNSFFRFEAKDFGVGALLLIGLGGTAVGLIDIALESPLCAEIVGVAWLSIVFVSRFGRALVASIAASPREISCISVKPPMFDED